MALWTLPAKLIVRQFYLQNTGLFLVVLLLGFGFLSSNEHIALATYALHDFFFLAGYVLLWLLYTIYVIRFSYRLFQTTDLLQLFRLVPIAKRSLIIYLLHLQLVAPVIFYAVFMLWIGSKEKTVLANGIVSLVVFALSVLPLPFVERALHHPNPEQFSGYLGTWFRHRITTPYGFFFIRYLFRQQPATLLLTKVGSCLVTIGILAIYPTDDYDIRLLLLGMLLSAALHGGIIFELYQFEATQLILLRNLPLPISRRWASYTGITALLVSPEAFIFTTKHPNDVSFLALTGVWLFGLSLLQLLYTSLLARHQARDRFMARLFWPLVVYFLLIMYRIPAGVMTLASGLVATFLFARHYYHSSWQTDQE